MANRYDDMEIAAKSARRHVVTNVERLFKRWREEYMMLWNLFDDDFEIESESDFTTCEHMIWKLEIKTKIEEQG